MKAGSAAVANPAWKISGLEAFSVTHTYFLGLIFNENCR